MVAMSKRGNARSKQAVYNPRELRGTGALAASSAQALRGRGRVFIDNGTLEALKWIALVFMTGDHINKYLLGDSSPLLFAFGRLVMPIFGFVLSYNLARPGALEAGVYERMAKRLLIVGLIASPAFIALGGLAWGWWPLNILFELLTTVGVIYCWRRGGWQGKALAVVVFLVGGSSVEFWWPAVAMNLCFYSYFKSGKFRWFVLSALFCAMLFVINRNQWALAAYPLVLLASRLKMSLPRIRLAFYVYYPALLYALLLIKYASSVV
jgi:hypothetical protein